MINVGTINNALTRGNKNEIVGWNVPDSNRVVRLGAAGTYTAPGNGWISAITTGTTRCIVKNNTAYLYNGGTHNTSNTEMGAVSCKKGDSVEIAISSGTCNVYFVPMLGDDYNAS